jgi:chaperonin GroES
MPADSKINTMTLKPLHDRIVVRAAEREQVTKGGILLPETGQEKPQRGTVVAAGPGRRDDSGSRIDLDIAVGDSVIFGKFGGIEIENDGEKLLIMRESDVFAVLTEDKA